MNQKAKLKKGVQKLLDRLKLSLKYDEFITFNQK